MTWLDEWDKAHGYSGVTNMGTSKKVNGKKPPTKKTGGGTKWAPCWQENHKPLKMGKGEILGAACSQPQKGYDIYIGLDSGMRFEHQKFPWENAAEPDPVIEFLYHITDMSVPKSPKQFKAMIGWMAEQLEAGKKIHIGCIGGHGRTGLVLAALAAHMGIPEQTGKKGKKRWKAIQWVRKHHCEKGVESDSQIKFLMKHFNVATAKASKGGYGGWNSTSTGNYHGQKYSKYGSRHEDCETNSVKSPMSIW